jgi:hypothetical protein
MRRVSGLDVPDGYADCGRVCRVLEMRHLGPHVPHDPAIHNLGAVTPPLRIGTYGLFPDIRLIIAFHPTSKNMLLKKVVFKLFRQL